MTEIVPESEPPLEVTGTQEEKDTIQQLSLKLLQQTELNNTLQQRIAETNRQLNQQKQFLVQARKEKHDADLEVTRLSTEVENITEELFEQANNQVREANVDAYNIKQMNERLSNTIKEKDTTIEILQTELSNLKNIISNMENSNSSTSDLTRLNSDSISNLNSKSDDIKGTDANKNNSNVLSHLSRQKTCIEESSRFPNCALFISKKLSPYNQKPIYSPLFNQIRFDSPAFNLFCDCLLPHISSHSTIADTVANELASHISSITSRPVLQSYNSTSSISNFDIRTTKFFLKLLDELDEDLKLDKAPSLQTLKLRWNRKNFLLELMDKSVTIEPLSASTESWKSQTLQKYMPLSNPPTPTIPHVPSESSNSNSNTDPLPSLSRYSTSSTVTAYDPSLFKLASNISSSNGLNSKNGNNSKLEGAVPLAVTASCGLCGEKRRDMNFSRLYHIKIKSDQSNSNNNNNENNNNEIIKYDYPLCINCANKYRAVVELLKFLATIHPNNINKDDDIDDYIRHCWIRYVELKSKVWYSVNIGIWNDRETFGLVYGWQNDWLTNHVKDEDKIIKEKQLEEQNEEKTQNSLNTKDDNAKNLKGSKNGLENKANNDITEISKNENIETTKDIEDNKSNKKDNTENNDDISVTSSNKGWKGWSGVIAKPAVTNNVDVGIGLVSPKRVTSSIEPKSDSIVSNDSKESKDTDEEEPNFEDANDGVD